MLYARLRYALIFLFAVLGVLLHVRLGFGAAWYLYLASLLLLLTHLLFGNVWGAFSLLRRGKPAQAERLLRQTHFPELLLPRNRAYYHFSRGMIHLHNKALDVGEQQLLKAKQLGLKQPVDQALLDLNLAHIHYLRRQYDEARRYLNQAKQQNADDLLIRQNVEKLEQALASLQ